MTETEEAIIHLKKYCMKHLWVIAWNDIDNPSIKIVESLKQPDYEKMLDNLQDINDIYRTDEDGSFWLKIYGPFDINEIEKWNNN